MTEDLFERAVSVPQRVLVQELSGSECVFLNLETEEYYGLGETGPRTWAALTDTTSVGQAYQRLLDEYDVDPATLRHDLEQFVGDLLARGLVELHST